MFTTSRRSLAAAVTGVAATAALLAPASAPSAGAAPTAAKLPAGCEATIGEQTGEAYAYGSKISTWSLLTVPKGLHRHTSFSSVRRNKEDAEHYLSVYPDGRVYDTANDVGVLGDDGDLRHLNDYTQAAGKTVKNVVDITAGNGTMEDGYPSGPTNRVYLVTSNGALSSAPLTATKDGSPRIGKPVPLRAKGVGPLKAVEVLGWNSAGNRLTRDVVVGLTRDGKLVELSVDRAAKTPTVKSVRTLATGWKSVAQFGLGECSEQPGKVVYLTVGTNKAVTAYIDPKWNDGTLKNATKINLGTWKRGAVNGLF